ncbi:hypothetical protein FQA47_011570 [Oryzias melastigma]|uniref:Fibronectin type-III domain-containing protein n=1 Tax=Oryzias melastigma TaxID=30732 RepID=A0A834CGM0_ORYME|nr:hypothetical protein FQA47_011570 [Oryzias melastigma]
MLTECGQNRSVYVIASNEAGTSSPSEPVNYITYPCPPENIWVEEPTAGDCYVKWEEVAVGGILRDLYQEG